MAEDKRVVFVAAKQKKEGKIVYAFFFTTKVRLPSGFQWQKVGNKVTTRKISELTPEEKNLLVEF